MNILVTGGAGFIGSHLVDAYVARGHRVSVVDNLDSGRENFVNPKAKFYLGDVSDFDSLEKIFKNEKPQMIAHLAAFDHIRLSVERPEDALRVNALGTLNVLKLMVKYKSKKIIFASTAGPLYGFQPKPLPVTEDYPIQSISPYGASKSFAEELIKLYNRLYKINYTIFRYPNVFGPRQFPKGEAKVVAVFSLQLLKGETPTLFGDGSKTRDYCYIDDVVRAHISAINRGNNTTINLGWSKQVKDETVLSTIQKVLKTSVKPIIGEAKLGEVYRFCLDRSRAKKLLNWEPRISFAEGIKLTMPYYKKYMETGIETRDFSAVP